jgi:heterodisulfide reductase subunit C
VSDSLAVDPQEELLAFTGTFACINCGTCTAVCPLPREDVLLPRQIIRLLHLGRREELRDRAEAIYSCLLCRLCEETCPAGVRIPDILRFLRGHLNRTVHHLERE